MKCKDEMPMMCIGCADLKMMVWVGKGGWHMFLQSLVPIKDSL